MVTGSEVSSSCRVGVGPSAKCPMCLWRLWHRPQLSLSLGASAPQQIPREERQEGGWSHRIWLCPAESVSSAERWLGPGCPGRLPDLWGRGGGGWVLPERPSQWPMSLLELVYCWGRRGRKRTNQAAPQGKDQASCSQKSLDPFQFCVHSLQNKCVVLQGDRAGTSPALRAQGRLSQPLTPRLAGEGAWRKTGPGSVCKETFSSVRKLPGL